MDLIVVFLLYIFFSQPCVCKMYFPSVTTLACYPSIFFLTVFLSVWRGEQAYHIQVRLYFDIFTRKPETSRNYIKSKSFYQLSRRYTQMLCKIFERKTSIYVARYFMPTCTYETWLHKF